MNVVKWQSGWSNVEFLSALIAGGLNDPDNIVVMHVRHDLDCAVSRGEECGCDPDVSAYLFRREKEKAEMAERLCLIAEEASRAAKERERRRKGAKGLRS